MIYADVAAPSPCNVLIIEDDDDDLFLLTRAFKLASAQSNIVVNVTHSPNGLEALGAVARGDLKSELFDLLIVDLNMPVLDGVKFLRALRGEFGFDNVRAVVLTTSDQFLIHETARDAGANQVFVKPNTQAELVTIVRSILSVN